MHRHLSWVIIPSPFSPLGVTLHRHFGIAIYFECHWVPRCTDLINFLCLVLLVILDDSGIIFHNPLCSSLCVFLEFIFVPFYTPSSLDTFSSGGLRELTHGHCPRKNSVNDFLSPYLVRTRVHVGRHVAVMPGDTYGTWRSKARRSQLADGTPGIISLRCTYGPEMLRLIE